MTIEIGSQKAGRIGRRGGSPSATSLPIGEVDANIFACPACSRPLGVGTSRCPTCGTRLIGGVRASRAITFVGIGVFSGIILSVGLMLALTLTAPRPVDLAVVVPPAVVPSQVPVASVAPPPVDPGIPSGALSALRQSTDLNRRVLVDAERLSAVLAASKPSSADIAPILRSLSSTASFGAGLAPTVAAWEQAGAVSTDLATFYAAIAATAEQGLSARFANTRAYVAAAENMLEIVAGLDAIDAASRALATSADLELPPLRVPSP